MTLHATHANQDLDCQDLASALKVDFFLSAESMIFNDIFRCVQWYGYDACRYMMHDSACYTCKPGFRMAGLFCTEGKLSHKNICNNLDTSVLWVLMLVLC